MIRIATYNVHKCRGLDRRTSPERIAKVIRELDADVIAIQEILDVRDDRAQFDQARTIAHQLDDYHWCFGENRKLRGGGYGNMTLSRFPIVACENYDVTWRHKEKRGCLLSDIDWSEHGLIHFFNVHLGTGFVERRHQGRLLVSERVLKRDDFKGPRIIVGDFNEWTRGLVSRLMSDSFEVAAPGNFQRYSRTYPGILPILHLDHFYFDKAIALKHFRPHRSRMALLASDHLPLVAEFEIPEA